MQPKFQESQNPLWNASLKPKRTHREQAISSRKISNHAELIEILMFMQQEMKAKDDQLKTQLLLRDNYFDAELKRRDQNLEDALRKRMKSGE